jgi:hypothetical protein
MVMVGSYGYSAIQENNKRQVQGNGGFCCTGIGGQHRRWFGVFGGGYYNQRIKDLNSNPQ